MVDFPTWHAYWTFAHSVRRERRYLLTEPTRDFLDAVRESADRRAEVLAAGTLLWRAQMGATTITIPVHGTDDHFEEDYPWDETRMKPQPGKAREGRANPKGIPYLYLATHRETATAEVRPWKGGIVSVGQFRAVRNLKLVNTTLLSKRVLLLGNPQDPSKREEAVWGQIDEAFSEPTLLSDDATEYVPTQVLAELFREAGYDGVGYRSAYGEGHNIVLFDIELAEQVNCFVVRVKDIAFTFDFDQQMSYSVKLRKTT